MTRVFKSLILVMVFLLMFDLVACENSTQKSVYTLSGYETQLVDKIYSCRGVWEKHNGTACSNIRFAEKNGKQFLLCSYSTDTGYDFWGEGSNTYVSIEVKYTISQNGMHEATLQEYGSNEGGIVTGLYGYDVNDKPDDKKLSLAKAITNKSMVVIP